jgi:ribonuclease HI
MKSVTLYTDGACSGNPGPGGWAAILRWRDREKILSGGEALTTNNRMELTAVIRGLEALKEPCEVTVYSDSRYVVEAMEQGWALGWRARGWKRRGSGEAKNPELWQRLLELAEQHRLHWVWVRGHAEDELNRRCDALAVAESRKYL